jgi:serine/threonine-protein kinase RsbW
MAEIANVCLSLTNRPENVLVVRQALAGVADSLALDALEANDLYTAVTEACNNVVLHAYGGDVGPLEVEVYVLAEAIAVVVRDRGRGITPDDHDRLRHQGAGGIGLPVINALSRRAQFTDLAGGGTEVRMEFTAPATASVGPLEGNGPEPATPTPTPSRSPSAVELRLAPNAIARAILPRVLSALAGRAYFSTDRICDVQLVADVLAANADESISGSHLHVGVTIAPRNLEMRIGPLCRGSGEGLVAAADGLEPVVERLTDAKRVALGNCGEMLELHLVDRR